MLHEKVVPRRAKLRGPHGAIDDKRREHGEQYEEEGRAREELRRPRKHRGRSFVVAIAIVWVDRRGHGRCLAAARALQPGAPWNSALRLAGN